MIRIIKDKINVLLRYLTIVICLVLFMTTLSSSAYAETTKENYLYIFDFGDVKKQAEVTERDKDNPRSVKKVIYSISEKSKYVMLLEEIIYDNGTREYKIKDKQMIGFSKTNRSSLLQTRSGSMIDFEKYNKLYNTSTVNLYDYMNYIFEAAIEYADASVPADTGYSRSKALRTIKAVLFSLVSAKDNAIHVGISGDSGNYISTGEFAEEDKKENAKRGYIRDIDFQEFAWLYNTSGDNEDYRAHFYNGYEEGPSKSEHNIFDKTDNYTIEQEGAKVIVKELLSDDARVCQYITDAIAKNKGYIQYLPDYLKSNVKIKVEGNTFTSVPGLTCEIDKNTVDKAKRSATFIIKNDNGTKFASLTYSKTPNMTTAQDVVYNSNYIAGGTYLYKEGLNSSAINSYSITGHDNQTKTYFAIPTSGGEAIDIVYFLSANKTKDTNGEYLYSTDLCRLYKENLEDQLNKALGESASEPVSNTETITNGNWKFELNKNTKIISVSEMVDGATNYVERFKVSLNEKDMYNSNVGYNNKNNSGTYGLSIGLKYDDEMEFNDVTNQSSFDDYGAFLTSVDVSYMSQLLQLYKKEYTKSQRFDNVFDTYVYDNNKKMILAIYDFTETDYANRGNIQILNLRDAKAGTLTISLDITKWITELYEDKLARAKSSIGSSLSAKIINYYDKVDENGNIIEYGIKSRAQKFINNILFKYGTPIMSFILFISILMAAIGTIVNNQNANERVLIKERMMKIIAAVIIFSSGFVILDLTSSYVEKNMESLMEAQEVQALQFNLNPVSVYTESSWYAEVIFSVVDGATNIINTLKEKIFIRYITTSAEVKTIGDIIMYIEGEIDPVTEEPTYEAMLYSPFSKNEWNIYMQGYALLSVISISILLIALIKNSGSLILFAGNSEKMAEIKQDYIRFVVGTFGILLAPFIIRLILLFFNSMFMLIPLNNNVTIDLEFSAQYGYLGRVADLFGAITETKVFAAFLVRKVMITFMLISAPIIFATWTVSNKFRSFSLWIGELITNCATQFFYGIVLFIVVLLSYDGQSPFMSLILVNMFIKLADFFKDSLQGLIQKAGGINETEVVNQSISQVKEKTQMAARAYKKSVNIGGSSIEGVANVRDRKRVSKGWMVARNVGGVLSGKLNHIETNKERYRRSASGINQERRFLGEEVEAGVNQINVMTKDEEALSLVKKIRNGTISEAELRKIKEKSESNEVYKKLLALDEKQKEYTEMSDAYNAFSEAAKKNKGFITRLQGGLERKAVNEYLSGDATNESSNNNKKPPTIQERSVAINNSVDEMSKLEEGKDDEEIKEMCADIIDQVFKMSMEDIDINITANVQGTGGNPDDTQREEQEKHLDDSLKHGHMALKKLASYGDFDIKNIEKILEADKNIERIKKNK